MMAGHEKTFESIRREAEQQDLKRAREIPSTYSNRAHVRVWGGLARLTFGERVSDIDRTVWSHSVTLTTADALALADLIYQQYRQELEDIEAYSASLHESEEEQADGDG